MSILSSNSYRFFGVVSICRPIFSARFDHHLSSNKEIVEREKQLIANNYDVLPVSINKGQGVYMWDIEGTKYLDFFSSYSTLNQGHCHPKIVSAIQEQAAILHHTSRFLSHNLMYQIAEKLTDLFNYERIFMTNTGVEGVESALKLARKWGYRVKKIPKDKAEIIFATGNFHGRTLAVISASTDHNATDEFGPLMTGYQIIPYNNLEKLEEKLQNPNVCAFIVEPIQGEAGAVVPDEGYLQGVRKLCTKYNVLWIDDEVQAGMARSGKLLAVHHEQVAPDIVILGKALSGGMFPIAALLANSSVMNCLTPGVHGSTFGGSPLACRVALAAIDVMVNENLAENAEKMGQILRTELTNRLDKNRVLAVRGKGLLNAIVLDSKLFSAKDIVYKLKESGLIVNYIKENMIRCTPALIITEQQLRSGIDILVETINNMPIANTS